MAQDVLAQLSFDRWEGPEPQADLQASLLGWLAFQRHEFQRKWRDLTPEQLAAWSIPPVELSVLGLIRHMQQVEHINLSWGLGGGERREPYGDEVARADAAIATLPSLDSPGLGHGVSLGNTLIKMLDEYALHSGQPHMLRFAALGELKR